MESATPLCFPELKAEVRQNSTALPMFLRHLRTPVSGNPRRAARFLWRRHRPISHAAGSGFHEEIGIAHANSPGKARFYEEICTAPRIGEENRLLVTENRRPRKVIPQQAIFLHPIDTASSKNSAPSVFCENSVSQGQKDRPGFYAGPPPLLQRRHCPHFELSGAGKVTEIGATLKETIGEPRLVGKSRAENLIAARPPAWGGAL